MKGKKRKKDASAVYETLKEDIIWLKIAPESIVNLSDLAESFGVSRTPIKEALIRLQTEGLVVLDASHFLVSPLSLERMREITEIRSILEVQANIWAMYRMSSDQLAALRNLKERILDLDDNAPKEEMFKLDDEFHLLLYKSCGNAYLAQLLRQLLNNYFRFWISTQREITKAVFFHSTLEMIEAIENKDEVMLRANSTKHIKMSLDEIISTFKVRHLPDS